MNIMKMTNVTLAIYSLAITSLAILTNCNSPADKVEHATEEVTEANKELAKADMEYMADMEIYKKEIAEQIEKNNIKISELKAKNEKEKAKVKAETAKRIAELDQKNLNMKEKLNAYQEEGKENWDRFKTEFNHDMEGLGKAFQDLGVDNKK